MKIELVLLGLFLLAMAIIIAYTLIKHRDGFGQDPSMRVGTGWIAGPNLEDPRRKRCGSCG